MKVSAGILPYKLENRKLLLYLAHMGGPYWRNKRRSWSVVKGKVEPDEELEAAAKREFFEETGQQIDAKLQPLGSVKSSGKTIYLYAAEANPSTNITSNRFEIEWPPHSGKHGFVPGDGRSRLVFSRRHKKHHCQIAATFHRPARSDSRKKSGAFRS